MRPIHWFLIRRAVWRAAYVPFSLFIAVLVLSCWLVGCQIPPISPLTPPPSSEVSPATVPLASPVAFGVESEKVWSLRACQSCHGVFAEGGSGPPLRTTNLPAAAFLAAVREGGGEMRAYGEAEISDAEINALYAWLQSLPAAAPQALSNDLGLLLPPAMQVGVAAVDLARPAALAVAPDGALLIAEHGDSSAGQVWQWSDEDGDGRFSRQSLLADDLARPSALLWLEEMDQPPALLIGATGGLYIWQWDRGVWLALAVLPGVDYFAVNGLALGSDGLLYLTQGAPLAGALASAGQSGAVWRLNPAELLAGDVQPESFATGMRNATGIAFSPSGAIYTLDSGLGWPFQSDVPDELNLLLGGGDYGWPAVWGQPTGQGSASLPPAALFPPGSGAAGLIYHSGRMFGEYANDQLVTLFGQEGAAAEAGPPRLVRVEIVSDVTGYHSYVHDFVSGLQRPFGLAEGPDGAIYVSDYQAGIVYRLYR